MCISKSEWLDDWYVLRGDHTDVEGTSEQWREIFAGMKKKEAVHHTRAAVRFTDTGDAILRSPRNCMSEHDSAEIPANKIEEFISECEKVIIAGEGEHEQGDGI